LQCGLILAERAAREIALETVKVEAVFHLDDERAAEGVEPIDRVRRDNARAIDGKVGDEIPIDVVAEGFVEPDTVLIDCNANGRAEDRRALEAAIEHVRLKGIALVLFDIDAADPLVELRRERCRPLCRNVGRRQALSVGWHLVAIDAQTGEGAGGDDRDWRQYGGGRRLRCGAVRCGLRKARAWQQCEYRARNRADAPELERLVLQLCDSSLDPFGRSRTALARSDFPDLMGNSSRSTQREYPSKSLR
jgi:hypothetical protein